MKGVELSEDNMVGVCVCIGANAHHTPFIESDKNDDTIDI